MSGSSATRLAVTVFALLCRRLRPVRRTDAARAGARSGHRGADRGGDRRRAVHGRRVVERVGLQSRGKRGVGCAGVVRVAGGSGCRAAADGGVQAGVRPREPSANGIPQELLDTRVACHGTDNGTRQTGTRRFVRIEPEVYRFESTAKAASGEDVNVYVRRANGNREESGHVVAPRSRWIVLDRLAYDRRSRAVHRSDTSRAGGTRGCSRCAGQHQVFSRIGEAQGADVPAQ